MSREGGERGGSGEGCVGRRGCSGRRKRRGGKIEEKRGGKSVFS